MFRQPDGRWTACLLHDFTWCNAECIETKIKKQTPPLLFRMLVGNTGLIRKYKMVNGLHVQLYCLKFTHSYTHSHTDGGVYHARQQPAGLGALLRDTLIYQGRAGDRTSTLPVATTATLYPLSHRHRSFITYLTYYQITNRF